MTTPRRRLRAAAACAMLVGGVGAVLAWASPGPASDRAVAAGVVPAKTIPTIPPPVESTPPPSTTGAPSPDLSTSTLPVTTTSAPTPSTEFAPPATELDPIVTGVGLGPQVDIVRLTGSAGRVFGATDDAVGRLSDFVPTLPSVPTPRGAIVTGFQVSYDRGDGREGLIDATITYTTPVAARDVTLFLHATLVTSSYVPSAEPAERTRSDGTVETVLSFDNTESVLGDESELTATIQAASTGGTQVTLDIHDASEPEAAAVLGGWSAGIPVLDELGPTPARAALVASNSGGPLMLEISSDYLADPAPSELLDRIKAALPTGGYSLLAGAPDGSSPSLNEAGVLRLHHALFPSFTVSAEPGESGGSIITLNASSTT